jgi:hypothetical protein
MRLLPGRHRRDELARLRAENTAQRRIIADLGRQLHQAQQTGPLGDTIPLPRMRSQTPAPAWPPPAWLK